jgi:hypothetical protein
MLHVNETKVGEFDIIGTWRVGCVIPARALRRDGTDKLRLLHPDATAPRAVSDKGDSRRLSFGLIRLKIFPAH